MISDCPGHLFVDIGLEELRPPIAVIGADESADRDVVEQAGQDHFFRQAIRLCKVGALQQVLLAAEDKAQLDEIHQRRFLGHLGKAWIVAHEQCLARSLAKPTVAPVRLFAVAQLIKQRAGRNPIAQLHHLFMFEFVGALGKCLGGGHRPILIAVKGDMLGPIMWHVNYSAHDCP